MGASLISRPMYNGVIGGLNSRVVLYIHVHVPMKNPGGGSYRTRLNRVINALNMVLRI